MNCLMDEHWIDPSRPSVTPDSHALKNQNPTALNTQHLLKSLGLWVLQSLLHYPTLPTRKEACQYLSQKALPASTACFADFFQPLLLNELLQGLLDAEYLIEHLDAEEQERLLVSTSGMLLAKTGLLSAEPEPDKTALLASPRISQDRAKEVGLETSVPPTTGLDLMHDSLEKAEERESQSLTDKVVPLELFERLKGLRAYLADKLNCKRFHICSNRVLEALTREQPTNDEQLRAIKGVGPHFCQQYGALFIENIVMFTLNPQANPPFSHSEALSPFLPKEALVPTSRGSAL